MLDNNNHLLGVITSQNMVQVVDDEMGEDYARLAGLTAEEDLTEPPVRACKSAFRGCLCCWDWACWYPL